MRPNTITVAFPCSANTASIVTSRILSNLPDASTNTMFVVLQTGTDAMYGAAFELTSAMPPMVNEDEKGRSRHVIVKSANQAPTLQAPHIRKNAAASTSNSTQSIIALILPPSLPSFRRLWNELLIKNENLFVSLCTINAYIATLGGGYFLCRYLSVAVYLAHVQRRIAVGLGDVHLVRRCEVNEAYNYMHAGMFEVALKVIRRVLAFAKQIDDTLLVSVTRSARLFCKRMRAAKASSTDRSITKNNNDEMYRIRTVPL